MANGRKTGGRKPGTPNKATSDIRKVAEQYSEEAVDILFQIARDSSSDPARVAACNAILDRAHGKPAQSLELSGGLGLTHEDRLDRLARGPDDPKTPMNQVEQDRLFTRLATDYEFYAPRALHIRTKAGTVYPFRLNTAQAYLHEQLESQKQCTGKVRALVLKGRQQGVSTYTEGRFFWLTTHRRGYKAFILTHLDESTTALFNMAKRFYENCPEDLRPSRAASNAKELTFDKLDSGYKVGTAGSKGVGRGETIQLCHGSEVAYWPNADTHVAGLLQAVPNMPGTEVILESTAAGPTGLFAEMCQAAMRGEGEYQLVFIPWFWQAEYREAAPDGLTPTAEELDYQASYGLDLEQLVWRRFKIAELKGVHNFRREYPATPAEAFSAEVPGALWTREQINNLRVHAAPDLKRIVVAIDPSGGDKERNDECGIVVVGCDAQKHGYVLADHSGRYSPEVWGSKAVALYRQFKADRIVAETNFGGDMVEAVIRMVDRTAPFKKVTASRGKHARAEPVAALYEQCMIAGTMIATGRGPVPIQDVRPGDTAWTRKGLKRVIAAGLTGTKPTLRVTASTGQEIVLTYEHPVFTIEHGFKHAVHIVPNCDNVLTWDYNTTVNTATPSSPSPNEDADHALQSSDGPGESLSAITLNFVGSDTSFRSTAITAPADTRVMNCFIALFGKKPIGGKFSIRGISTISTGTLGTITRTIWLRCLRQIIQRIILAIRTQREQKANLAKLGWTGGHGGFRLSTSVSSATSTFLQQLPACDFAALPVTRATGVGRVVQDETLPVYNLTIEECPEFFANGILVHNCRMHHVGTHIGLEDEMVTWVPLTSTDSPNRIDAMVWAATELLVDGPGTFKQSPLRV